MAGRFSCFRRCVVSRNLLFAAGSKRNRQSQEAFAQETAGRGFEKAAKVFEVDSPPVRVFDEQLGHNLSMWTAVACTSRRHLVDHNVLSFSVSVLEAQMPAFALPNFSTLADRRPRMPFLAPSR